jgi:hypothetical protein
MLSKPDRRQRLFSCGDTVSLPTNWRMSPVKAWQWVDDVMSKEFPLGLIKDTTVKSHAD